MVIPLGTCIGSIHVQRDPDPVWYWIHLVPPCPLHRVRCKDRFSPVIIKTIITSTNVNLFPIFLWVVSRVVLSQACVRGLLTESCWISRNAHWLIHHPFFSIVLHHFANRTKWCRESTPIARCASSDRAQLVFRAGSRPTADGWPFYGTSDIPIWNASDQIRTDSNIVSMTELCFCFNSHPLSLNERLWHVQYSTYFAVSVHAVTNVHLFWASLIIALVF